ncbi:MAG: DUF3048 domain-containing protein [Candidatus Aenigmarchaeota archaeon]|nr:DUF3048 domain-containing protein [Candidatus Aenigmarchaeota archaeon]
MLVVEPKPRLRKRIIKFIKKHKISVIIVSLAFLIFGIVLYFYVFKNRSGVTPFVKKETPTPTPKLVRAPLSGVMVTEDRAKRKPIAVSIENHTASRPQSGLNKASLVYEALAEGGITRFLAFFQENDVFEIGPVRSARPYFLDWLSEFDALFAHCGGSVDALDLIVPYGIKDLDEFRWGTQGYWRDSSRYAPHNLYTSTEKLYEIAKKAGYKTTALILGYSFKEDLEKSKRPEESNITIGFNYPYNVSYKYDPKTNYYLRSVAGASHTDRITDEQIKAKNIVVIFMPTSYGYTKKGEQAVFMETIGSGEALVFFDGTFTHGTWKKDSRTSRTKFLDSKGEEIKFNAGTTWIEVVPPNTKIVY